MTSRQIIDFHAHVFPEKIASRAIASISAFYDQPMESEGGTVSDLLAVNDSAGITFSVVFSTATRIEQVESINQFMAECQKHPALIAFGSLHPAMTAADIAGALRQIITDRLGGIKMHPDFQQFNADDPFMMEVCRQLQGRLPLLLHAGDPRYDFSHPRRIRRLAEKHPETTIVAAHFGGWNRWHEAVRELAHLPNILVDTSSSLELMTTEQALDLIKAFGVQRVLFGSDYPMWRPADEVARLHRLGLAPQDEAAILWGNSASLLSVGSGQ